jgi:hypothetical protein
VKPNSTGLHGGAVPVVKTKHTPAFPIPDPNQDPATPDHEAGDVNDEPAPTGPSIPLADRTRFTPAHNGTY